MMTTEDFFNSKLRVSDEVSSLKILQDYNFQYKTLHIFVEADDDYNFYLKSIEKIYSDFKPFVYPKNGKNFVISTYDFLDWSKYDKSRILFFVDKDYEDLLGICSKKDRNIFVTKYYSIENYISSSSIFKYCLKEIFKIKSTSIIDDLVTKFETSFKVFESEMLFLTSIILIYRRNNSNLVLDKIKMDDLFYIQNLTFKTYKYKRENIYNRIKTSTCSAEEKKSIVNNKKIVCFTKAGADLDLLSITSIINNVQILREINDCQIYIRGKYQLWFFINFFANIRSYSSTINELLKAENNVTNSEHKNMNVSIDINERNIFDLLPMKVDTHDDVNDFLIHNKQNING